MYHNIHPCKRRYHSRFDEGNSEYTNQFITPVAPFPAIPVAKHGDFTFETCQEACHPELNG